MVDVDPEEHDLERRRKEQGIPIHLDFLPETGQLRIPVRNGYRARGVPQALRILANNIEAIIARRDLTAGQVAFDIHCAVREAQYQISGRVKKRKM